MRSVSSARLRCARAVSGRHPAPRPRDRRPRQARLLASLSPPADRPRVPCLRRACRLQPAHLVAWRPRNHRRCKLARTRPEKPVRTPGGSGRLGCSRLSRRPPIAPGSPMPMFGARHRALAPIRRLRPADAGVCASRSGGGTSDNRTLPETVRNGAHLQTFLTGQSLQGQSPLECSVCLELSCEPLGHLGVV